MDFTPALQGKRYERTIRHSFHILRAQIQGFRPLTEAQYNALCDKIEQS